MIDIKTLPIFIYKGHKFRYLLIDKSKSESKSIDIIDGKLEWIGNRNYDFRYHLCLYSSCENHFRMIKFNEWGIEQEEKLCKFFDSMIEA